MARQVLPFAGAAVGFFLGGPTGAQIGFAIGSIVGNAVDPQTIQGPKIGEAALQTSAEGVFRPIVFGTGAIKGNVIVRGNRQVKTQRTQQGKGGGPVVEEQRVYWTFAIRLCEPVAGILRIWQDEKLVYDVRPGSPIAAESSEYAERFRFYDGGEAQLPDPDLEAFQGIGNTSAYRGSAYVVFPNFDLTDRRESIPDFRFEVAASAEIQSTDALAIVNTVGPNRSAIPSPDGVDWDAEPYPSLTVPGTIDYLVALPTHYVGYGSGVAALPYWTDDQGLTWTQAAGPAFTPTQGGSFYNGVLLISAANQVARSTDEGISYSLVSIPGVGQGMIGFAGSLAILTGLSNTANLYVSPDLGLSWSAGTNSGQNITLGAASSPTDMRYFGGTGLAPLIHSTLNGTTTTSMPLPAITADFVVVGAFGTIPGGDDIWIAVSQDGEVLRDSGTGWELMPWTVLGAPSDVVFVGSGFIIASAGTGSFDNRMYFTVDGLTGSPVSLADPVSILSVASLPTAEQSVGIPIPLSTIVTTLHGRIGQAPQLIDVSELDDLVAGVVFAGDYQAADAIRTLMPMYSFDASEYDAGLGYKIHYPKRGKPVVTTLTIDTILDYQEKTTREDGLERPKVLHLHYENPTIGYAPAKATVRRNSTDILVTGERSVQVPVSFEDVDEPAQIADRLMRQTWVEIGGEEVFTIPDNFVYLVPSDCVGVSLRGQTRRMRIVRQEIGAGSIRMTMLPDRQSAYTSNVTGVPVPEPTPPLPSIVGQTIYSPMDIPALNDNNDILGWYDAASGQTEAWYGAQTQHKTPSDVEFTNSATFNQNTIMGMLLDDVPSASEHYTDTTNVVRVQLFTDDVIESLTDAQFLSEGGSFALSNGDGTWEILQYRDADDEGSNVFALSHLARGRLNSGATAHSEGVRFVLLDAVKMVSATTSYIGLDLTHRAVSFGTAPDTAAQVTEEFTGKSQTEFPVAHLFLERDVNTIEAITVPRHRFGTEDNPIQSLNWLGYRWTATDGTNVATIPDGTSPTISFDATGWGSPIDVTVAQINRFTGPGPTVSEQIA